jgi:hypothetical protein
MKKMKAYSADAEASGLVVLTLTESIRTKEFLPILQKYHLDKIDPDQWYSHQTLLDFFHEIQEVRQGTEAMYDLVAIGIKAVEMTGLPPFDPAAFRWTWL